MIVKAPITFSGFKFPFFMGYLDDELRIQIKKGDALILLSEQVEFYPKNALKAAYRVNPLILSLSEKNLQFRNDQWKNVNKAYEQLSNFKFIQGSVFLKINTLEKYWISCYDLVYLKGFQI